jgi:hypothetical protein
VVDVLGVHGIGQQQGGRNQLLPAWQAGLADGVERAKGYDAPKPSLDIAYYGDVFLPETDDKGAADPFEDIEGDELDDLVSFFDNIEGELVAPTQKLDEPKDKGRLPKQVSRLAAWLEQKFGIAGKTLFFGDLVQVRRFQKDDDLAAKVFDRVSEGLKHKPRVLIGHSLGSVVAYEALCRIPNHGITTLITLGSPLGLRSIREALRPEAIKHLSGLPPGITRWVNVYDKGDPVSLAGGLAAYWPEVKDRTVNNEDQPHAITRYLGKKEVGQAVTDALT